MSLYENKVNAENKIEVSTETKEALIFGTEEVFKNIIQTIRNLINLKGRPVAIAFDGWMGVDWEKIRGEFLAEFLKFGLSIEIISINR